MVKGNSQKHGGGIDLTYDFSSKAAVRGSTASRREKLAWFIRRWKKNCGGVTLKIVVGEGVWRPRR